MKLNPDTTAKLVESAVALWMLAMALCLFAAPFVVIGLVVAHLWGAA